ncbi:hydrolase [Halalkalibacter wakoensis JCM 9140]|uniref:Hydrolase n=1 Tax=Halalkalibacter wakoensis JCM 9140 TaxID=1236970 RepID=W4Q1H4_9BACI|nr:HAD family hydrolase [Halalkalibacter wakoensis]GAE25229.1 hydrolase [Halalkalibacter wakoensis JCM 9140]
MIFFDIDSTLLDHEQAEELGAIEFFEENKEDIKCNTNEFVALWHHLSDTYFEKYLEKELSFLEQRRMRMKELLGSHISNDLADEKFNEYITYYKKNWKVFEDVIPSLEQMKKQGKRLGIISNGDENQQMEKLETIKIRKYFDCIVTSSKVGISKPNITIFIEACNLAKVKAEECYYIGDRVETDAIASTQAGMRGIWLNRKNTMTRSEIVTIHSLHELATIIK